MKKYKGIVVYDSKYGNTKKIALALTVGLRQGIEIDCMRIDEVDQVNLPKYGFIALGGPTHIIRTSKEMKDFLKKLRTLDLSGLKGFAFDTRNESRMNSRAFLTLDNSAARVIECVLRRKKVDILRPRQSALVEGREGPLHRDMENMFTQIGEEIAGLLKVPVMVLQS